MDVRFSLKGSALIAVFFLPGILIFIMTYPERWKLAFVMYGLMLIPVFGLGFYDDLKKS